MYGHGKLDLKFVHGRTKKLVGSNKVCPEKVYTSKAEIAEEKSRTTSFGENGLFSCERICFGKQLLLQINIYCQEVMQNNGITYLMGQPLLDACSIQKSDYQVAMLAFNSKS